MANFLNKKRLHDPPKAKIDPPLRNMDFSAELPPELQSVIQSARARSDRVLHRAKPTAARAGMGLSTLWREVKNRVFVPPIAITSNTCGWLELEIDAVIEARKIITRCELTVDMRLFVYLLTKVNNHDNK
jgi:predicted DNA-binding transcriptional regulator AlpA